MSNPRKSLASYVQWSRLAGKLDIHLQTAALPATTLCIFCDGMMDVYPDPQLGGEWFHCSSCERQGDMIQLAAAAWKLEIAETINRLNHEGFDIPSSADDIEAYMHQHVRYRNRLRQLWGKGITQLDNHRNFLRLNSRLNTLCNVSTTRALSGPARILRGSDVVAVERCFAPGSMKHADARPQKHNPSERALFRGSGWGEVMLTPFFDLHHRICAFVFFGRKADRENDIVFKRANFGPARPSGNEAGLAMHPGVPEVAQRWDNSVIAMGDLVSALQLQMRQLENWPTPLPIVCWHDSTDYPAWHNGKNPVRTCHAWNMLGNRNIVFWMPKVTAATFQQAIIADGKISTVGPRDSDVDSLKEYCWKYTPEDLAQHILEHAEPWPKVLSKFVEDNDSLAFEQLICRLEQNGVDLNDVDAKLTPAARLALARIRSSRLLHRSICFGGGCVVETNSGWHFHYLNRPPELIMDASLQIDAIVLSRRNDERFYAGRVEFDGQQVEFCVPEKEIKTDCFEWMRNLLASRIQKYLIGGGRSRTKHILEMALRFHRPKVIQGVDRVGFERENFRFVFPKFSIERQGKVSELKHALFPDEAPAAHLVPSTGISPEQLERPECCNESGVTEVFWAFMACALANIIAPTFNRRPEGIILKGHIAGGVGIALARAIGCTEICPRSAAETKQVKVAEHRHGWPILLNATRLVQRRFWLPVFESEDGEPRNIIASMDVIDAKLLAIQGGWCTISTEHAGRISEDTVAMAGELIPAYLQDICKRSYVLNEGRNLSAPFVERVFSDLATFVKARHGDEGPVLEAVRCVQLDTPINRANALAELLVDFIDKRQLEVRQTEGSSRKRYLLEVQHEEQDGILIPYSTLEKLTKQSLAPLPGAFQLAQVMENAEVLFEERDEGLVVQRDWFDSRRRLLSVAKSRRLKVHG